jgi:5'-3' exonuclease
MGVKNLRKLLEKPVLENISFSDFSGSFFIIDGLACIFNHCIGIRNTGSDIYNIQRERVSEVYACISIVLKCLKSGIKPIFVFDGYHTNEKNKEVERRKKKKKYSRLKLNEMNSMDKSKMSKNDQNNIEKEIIKHSKRTFNIDSKSLNKSIEILRLMGIPTIISPHEADPQCAALAMQLESEGKEVYVLTNDFDILLCGASKIIKLTNSKGKKIEQWSINEIIGQLKRRITDIEYRKIVNFVDDISNDEKNVNDSNGNILGDLLNFIKNNVTSEIDVINEIKKILPCTKDSNLICDEINNPKNIRKIKMILDKYHFSEKFTRENLIDICCLFGNDYCDGILVKKNIEDVLYAFYSNGMDMRNTMKFLKVEKIDEKIREVNIAHGIYTNPDVLLPESLDLEFKEPLYLSLYDTFKDFLLEPIPSEFIDLLKDIYKNRNHDKLNGPYSNYNRKHMLVKYNNIINNDLMMFLRCI